MKRHQPFKEWHPHNLVDFLQFIEKRHPKLLKNILEEYDECLMGN
jgi:hypothetical protein